MLFCINYSTFQPNSLPLNKIAFDCLTQCCWVESKKESVSSLSSILTWALQNKGKTVFLTVMICNIVLPLAESEASKLVLGKLIQVIRHLCFDSSSKNSSLLQSELLHIILGLGRENKVRTVSTTLTVHFYTTLFAQVSVSQMKTILLLCVVVVSPTSPPYTPKCGIELEPWLVSFTLPTGAVLKEKVNPCQILNAS